MADVPDFMQQVILSAIACTIAVLLLTLYYRRSINIVQVLVYGFITQTYAVEVVGPSVSTLYLISFVFIVEEAWRSLVSGVRPSRTALVLLAAPIFSIIGALMFFLLDDTIFEFKGSGFGLVLRPFFFYLKQYLPLFVIGLKVSRESDKLGYEDFYAAIRGAAVISCCGALLQYAVHYAFGNIMLDELVGLKRRYILSFAGIDFVRVQGWCTEPKNFSSLMAISLPLLLMKKRYVMALLASVLALLTIGQTFPALLLVAFSTMIVCGKVSAVRPNLLSGLAVTILLFMLISAVQTTVADYYGENRGNIAVRLLLERATERYKGTDDGKIRNILGIPLQSDLEQPVVNYFRDRPWLLLTGYGPANSAYLPAEYWRGNWNYQSRLEKNVPNHMNMRWLFYLSEFGIFVFVLLLVIMTRFEGERRDKIYYSFLLCALFFSEIELFVIIMFALQGKKAASQAEDPHLEVLPSHS